MDAEEDEACTICLEPLSHTVPKLHTDNRSENNLYIATLSGCQHIYHHICIEEWAERTNTCPSCRTRFEKLTIRQYLDGPIVNQIGVDDRVQPANIPESTNTDLDIQPEDYIVFETEGFYGNCVICQGGDRSHELLICDGCDRTFHVTCLGIGGVPGGDWYCPSCELDNDYGFGGSHPRTGRAINRSSHRTAFRGSRSISRRGRSRRGVSQNRAGLGLIQSADSRLVSLRSRRRMNWSTRSPTVVAPPLSSSIPQSLNACTSRTGCEHHQSSHTIVFNSEEVEAWNMLEQALVESGHDTGNPSPLSSDPDTVSTPISASATYAAASSSTATGESTSSHSVASGSSVSLDSSSKKLKLPTRSARHATQSHNNSSSVRTTPAISSNIQSSIGNMPEDFSSSPVTPMRVTNLLSHIRTPTSSHLGNGAISNSTTPMKSSATTSERKNSIVAEGSSNCCSPSPPPSTSDLAFSKKERVQSMVKDILRPMYRAGKIDKHQYTEVCRNASRGLYEVVKQQESTNSNLSNDKLIVPLETVGRYVHIELLDGFGLKLLS